MALSQLGLGNRALPAARLIPYPLSQQRDIVRHAGDLVLAPLMPAEPVHQRPPEPSSSATTAARRPDQDLLVDRPDAETRPGLLLGAVVQPRAALGAEPPLRDGRYAELLQGTGAGGGPLEGPWRAVEGDEEGARLLAALRALAGQRVGGEVVGLGEGDCVAEGAADAASGNDFRLGAHVW